MAMLIAHTLLPATRHIESNNTRENVMTALEGNHIRRETVVENTTGPAVVPTAVAPVVPASGAAVASSYTRRFAPDALIAALVGLALLVVGLIAMARGGFDGPLRDPVVSVLGFTHTTILGMIEAGIGACLLAAGAVSSRGGEVFFGLTLGVGAFVGAVQTETFRDSLALESSFAWLCVAAAAAVVIAALALPRYTARSTHIESV